MSSKIPIAISFTGVANFLGVAGVIGSLIFVALELRQSQRIALAAQQQARTAMMYSNIVAHTQAGLEYRSPSVTDENLYIKKNGFHANLLMLENDYLQYQLGVMTAELWDSKRDVFKRITQTCYAREIMEIERNTGLPQEIVDLWDEYAIGECRQ